MPKCCFLSSIQGLTVRRASRFRFTAAGVKPHCWELLPALQGKEVRDPSTTLGSNARRGAQPRKPAAIFVGAGFAKEDYEAFRRDVHDATGGTVWVREEKTDVEGLDDPSNWVVREGVGRVPKPEVLIRSISKCLMRDLGAQ
jgi:hypothetical protein